ncbi:MAG: threonylcarbamoyl-AMP synthase [Armatimonadetes bacterium]|nr:threonylcarbamoyl-AMP synthase [Armatimonadota bacterium]
MSVRVLSFAAGMDDAASILAEGGLLLFPTETVYGIGARWDRADAVSAVYLAKGRPADKPLQVLVGSAAAARFMAAAQAPAFERLASAFWPGALTIVVPAAPGLPREVLAADGTVGLRCPNHAGLRALLQVSGPLAASSANRSTEPPATNCADAVAALGDYAQLALDSGPCVGGVPSTVVRLVGDELTVLRAGALDEARLREVADHG